MSFDVTILNLTHPMHSLTPIMAMIGLHFPGVVLGLAKKGLKTPGSFDCTRLIAYFMSIVSTLWPQTSIRKAHI